MTDFKFLRRIEFTTNYFINFQKSLLFLTNTKMKDSTKIAYMLLKARLEIIINKRQIDEEGNVYFTYTTK